MLLLGVRKVMHMKNAFFFTCSMVFFLSKMAWAQVNFQSSNLPIVVINTFGQSIPDEPKIMANMGIIDNGTGQRNYLNQSYNSYFGSIGIELRGSSSQDLSDKKPYAVETRNADGSNLNTALLGMPSENDWVFLAPYSDKSLIRDVLAYTLARRIMPWAPRSRFVELIVNGDYKGVYAVLESIKKDNDRVDISTLNPDENSGDDLTGGYILKIDKWTGAFNDGFNSPFPPPGNPNAQIVYQYHYPRPDDISIQQKAYIQQYINNFEQVMASVNYTDPQTGYPSVIDVSSFVDFFLINEITRNVDGYRLSTFMYKNKDSNGGKLRMGPVWDFNIAFGNANYCSGNDTHGWAINFNWVCPSDAWLIPFWWDKLRNDPAFRGQVRTRWQQLRASTFSNTAINGIIDSLAAVVQEGQVRNFQRWPILGQWVWPNAFVGNTFASEINYLKTWLAGRVIWMDNEINSFPVSVREPWEFALRVNAYPNPLGSGMESTLECTLPYADEVALEIFGPGGICVHREQRTLPAGLHTWTWTPSRPGFYTYRFLVGGIAAPGGKLAVW